MSDHPPANPPAPESPDDPGPEAEAADAAPAAEAAGRPRVKELTQEEIDSLPLDKRLELLALERQSAEAQQARQDAEQDRRRQARRPGVLLPNVASAPK